MSTPLASPQTAPFGSAVRDSSTQAVSTGVFTAITFTTEEFDTGGMVDIAGANTKVTIVTPGPYLVRGQIVWAASSTGVRVAGLRKNGSAPYLSRVSGPAIASGDYIEQEVSWFGNLVAGDYIELMGYQGSGGNLNVRGDDSTATFPRLQAIKL